MRKMQLLYRQYRYHENKENKMKYQKVKEKNNLHFK